MKDQIYVCPTCKSWKYLEIFRSMNPDNKTMRCYCRRCEEGCVDALLVDEPLTTENKIHA